MLSSNQFQNEQFKTLIKDLYINGNKDTESMDELMEDLKGKLRTIFLDKSSIFVENRK